jgi:hypothetical protein
VGTGVVGRDVYALVAFDFVVLDGARVGCAGANIFGVTEGLGVEEEDCAGEGVDVFMARCRVRNIT